VQRDLIHRLAAEVARVCRGRTWERALPRPGEGLALLPAEPGEPALDLSPLPLRGWIAATTVRLKADAAPGGAGRAALGRELAGRSLLAVAMLSGDRVVRLTLDDGRALVVELLGAAGNLYLLDTGGVISCILRSAHRPGGRLAVGDAWRPPGAEGAGAVGPAAWEEVPPAPSGRPGLASLGPTRAIDALDDAAVAAVALCPDEPPGAAVFEPARLLGDAVLRRAWLLERNRLAGVRLASWRRRLRLELARLRRLQASLEKERARAGGHEAMRRQAECLAAGLARARREGQMIHVPDLYGAPGEQVSLALRPGERPAAAMERLFRRAGRLQRGEARVIANLETARRQSVVVAALAEAAERMRSLEDLEAGEEAAPAWLRKPVQGRAPAPAGRGKKDRPRDPRERKVRRYLLVDDWHLVVGGDAAVNDYVSFRLASPRDFWLHVADYPGSHVLLRNPRRLDDPPTNVLHQAAAVAAWFSKAREKGPVQVRWTQARYLRKGKGLPVGTVLLPRASTVTVEAAAPPRRQPGSPA
jgi:predicted ribosome quality control (RQC) complex YloA/Tae2 family protein